MLSYLLVKKICLFQLEFFSRAERRSINHLCWSSDETDPRIVVSLYFTLHLYFGNVVNVLFSKQSTRCWRSFERELWEHKFICLLGTKTPTGLNIKLKHYGRELYEAFPTLLHKIPNFYLISQ